MLNFWREKHPRYHKCFVKLPFITCIYFIPSTIGSHSLYVMCCNSATTTLLRFAIFILCSNFDGLPRLLVKFFVIPVWLDLWQLCCHSIVFSHPHLRYWSSELWSSIQNYLVHLNNGLIRHCLSMGLEHCKSESSWKVSKCSHRMQHCQLQLLIAPQVTSWEAVPKENRLYLHSSFSEHSPKWPNGTQELCLKSI